MTHIIPLSIDPFLLVLIISCASQCALDVLPPLDKTLGPLIIDKGIDKTVAQRLI